MTKAYFLYLNRDHIYWDISSFLENVILLLQYSRRAVETMDDGHCADYLMKRLEEMLQKFQKISLKTDSQDGEDEEAEEREEKTMQTKEAGKKKSRHLQLANQQSRRTCGC